jgi:hypothetical protein
MSTQKVDKSTTLLLHRWRPFVGVGAPDSPSGSSSATKGVTLPAGNYEWPFEYMLPGDTCESVEGLPEASVIYKLKATVTRGKLSYDLHAYKRLRIIRTLEASALEFHHAMSVDNIWPNKVEYSIVVPRKAVIFGTSIPLETRITPLLKGLDLGDISIKLVEIHDLVLHNSLGQVFRQHRKEKEVTHWTIQTSRDDHWHNMIEDTGQEGWVVNANLDLPRRLGKCVQDVNVRGIKVRHKLKLTVALKNPDGHTSELRATLPVTIFISPNLPLDEEGNLVRQPQGAIAADSVNAIAPPVYGAHILDELYQDVDISGLQTPGLPSEYDSPLYTHSRTSSAENLAAMLPNTAVPPAALSSRLQSMSLDPSHRNGSFHSRGSGSGSGGITPYHPTEASHPSSQPASAPLSRQVSREASSGTNTPEHVDFPDLTAMSKVPSYQTAVRTPVRPLNFADGSALPDYETAMSAPASPILAQTIPVDPLAMIPEVSHEQGPGGHRPSVGMRRQSSVSISSVRSNLRSGDLDERRRLHLIRARDRIL